MAPQVTLYAHASPTPNPMKVLIMLEALGINYVIVHKKMGEVPNGVKRPEYLKINPNGRLPALIDHTNCDFIIWESGAILLYLAERFDVEHKFHGVSLIERTEVWQWLMFQMSTLGPYQGQANWFIYLHSVKPPELHPSVVERYQNETRRIYRVLEQRLTEAGDWLALGRFSVADMAHFPWLRMAYIAQVDLTAFPKLSAYVARLEALPSIKRAYAKIPDPW